MKVPSWIQEIVDRFNAKTEPHSELEIAESLTNERSKHGEPSEEDWKGYIAEYSVFFFGEGGDGESVWGTYFRPMVESPCGLPCGQPLDHRVTRVYLLAAPAAFFFSICTVQGGTMPFCRA
jgi:hypothetical protein